MSPLPLARSRWRAQATRWFDRFAGAVARWSGSAYAFCAACVVVLVWAATGPLFGYSDSWQLWINTGTTVVTFLMVFAIQHQQEKDTAAVQKKLDEVVRATPEADDAVAGCEQEDGRDRG